MLRENTFRIGGALTIALGAGLAYGLIEAGAGLEFLDAWLAAGFSVGLGAFFLYVAHDETRVRREYLRSLEPSSERPSGPRPP